MATQVQVKAFIKRIAPIAQAKSKGRVLPSVCIAQACCESAYGTSPKMVKANALFGIKVGKSKWHFGKAWKDKAYSTKTKECYDGKTYVNITDMFRAYDSVEDAVEDYYDMLSYCKRYKACVGEKDPRKCITAIKNGGYATSPTYITTIMGIIDRYNLTQYDSIPSKVTAASKPKITIDHNPFAEPTSNIKLGSKGEGVKWTQWCLWRFGLISEDSIDGVFGVNTNAAVKEAQKRLGLNPNGIVESITKNTFKKVCKI